MYGVVGAVTGTRKSSSLIPCQKFQHSICDSRSQLCTREGYSRSELSWQSCTPKTTREANFGAITIPKIRIFFLIKKQFCNSFTSARTASTPPKKGPAKKDLLAGVDCNLTGKSSGGAVQPRLCHFSESTGIGFQKDRSGCTCAN